MKLTIDLSPAQAERLRQEAERLGFRYIRVERESAPEARHTKEI
jgi:hypothetical protein